MQALDIVYVDNHLLVVNKPAGVLIQADETGDRTLLQQAKTYLKETFQKPGNVYLGLVHRLDRPVSGVVAFARTSKAAARLSEQFRNGTVTKTYRALIRGKVPESGELRDILVRKGSSSRVARDHSGKLAILSYQRVHFKQGISMVEVALETGRHHQIRVQFANIGFPVIGDFRYGSKEKFPLRSIALHAYSLCLSHPIKKEEICFSVDPPLHWPVQ